MSDFIDIAEFRRLARTGATPERRGITAMSARSLGPIGERIVRFVFSDGSLDRVGDTIDAEGWVLDNYLRNPIVLFAHNALAPPIGRTVNLFVDGGRLIGDVQFAEPAVYDFADTIFRLIQSGYINAGSVGFLPIDYTFSNEKGRDFGVDFFRQELLEFSICAVPANANALIAGKAAGLISAAEFKAIAGDVDDQGSERLRREARMAALQLRARVSDSDRLPSRGVLALQFAGTLADRHRQVDIAYPGLARQERREELDAIADRNSAGGRQKTKDAWARYMRRVQPHCSNSR